MNNIDNSNNNNDELTKINYAVLLHSINLTLNAPPGRDRASLIRDLLREQLRTRVLESMANTEVVEAYVEWIMLGGKSPLWRYRTTRSHAFMSAIHSIAYEMRTRLTHTFGEGGLAHTDDDGWSTVTVHIGRRSRVGGTTVYRRK